MTLKIGDKELKIKFAYTPVLKERLISKFMKLSGAAKGERAKGNEIVDDLERTENLLLYLPEILLIGLQKYHEEYRYDYDTKDGKKEQLEKMFDLIDDYGDEEDADFMKLFNDLQEELLSDSFLKSLFQGEQKAENASRVRETAKEKTEN